MCISAMMCAECFDASSKLCTKLTVKQPCGAFCMNKFGKPWLWYERYLGQTQSARPCTTNTVQHDALV